MISQAARRLNIATELSFTIVYSRYYGHSYIRLENQGMVVDKI
jgi:hypothetical protein